MSLTHLAFRRSCFAPIRPGKLDTKALRPKRLVARPCRYCGLDNDIEAARMGKSRKVRVLLKDRTCAVLTERQLGVLRCSGEPLLTAGWPTVIESRNFSPSSWQLQSCASIAGSSARPHCSK